MEFRSLYDAVWLVDFEIHQPGGQRPQPICMVAKEFWSGTTMRFRRPEHALGSPPLNFHERSLLVAYYASAELGCFHALGWPMPANILDLYAEFRCLSSGLAVPHGHGLAGALDYFGLNGVEALEKKSMRDLALRGGPFTPEEQKALLMYCERDVLALERLLPTMLPHVDLNCALLRGRYMAAVAQMEWHGIPVDREKLDLLTRRWETIETGLVERFDRDFGVFAATTFKAQRWEKWLACREIPWPRLPSGRLDLKEETFRQMARIFPEVDVMRQLRHTLSQLKLNDLQVGADGRNRTLLSPFHSKTGRNQPSTSKFIFGTAVWLRSLIRPTLGSALAYIDYEQQEFGIAAALSRDEGMMKAYRSGDPYLAFAAMAKAVPEGATTITHQRERELFKTCALGVQYGMQAEALALRLRIPVVDARELLRLHRETFPRYWKWSDAVEERAMLTGKLESAFGWKTYVGSDVNPRSLRNFPLQANGAEILRIACCLTSEHGIHICAPVHDAILIEAPDARIEHVVAECQHYLRKAGEIVLEGFPLRTEASIIRYPDHYSDPRGVQMWQEVWKIIGMD